MTTLPWLKWLPWRYLLQRVAHAHGFLDPIGLLARLRGFAQPSEVAEPIELLRAGVVFHARGLINSRVIQHNLDWIWPYWVERQFDPGDDALLPRAFSITHVNLTHRNWTAIGTPDCDELPVVDPAGLITPFFDGWSLDAWCISDDGRRLLPSKSKAISQRLCLDDIPTIITEVEQDGLALTQRAAVHAGPATTLCSIHVEARSDGPGWLVLALRPYNPEGISFIHEAALAADRKSWRIDDKHLVTFDTAPERHHVSNYRDGDVAIHLRDAEDQQHGKCPVGMVTAAALFRLEPNVTRTLDVSVPIHTPALDTPPTPSWRQALEGTCAIDVPDDHYRFLYDAALRTLVLHSPGAVYPGPYTYKRFWFRDAAFIVNAMLCAGLTDRAERALDRFPELQTVLGYFHSQQGEWDSNGEVLWIFNQFCTLTNCKAKTSWWNALVRGAHWIERKRMAAEEDTPHAGLLPAGFSAEHLGASDYYYWDDFWSQGGLRAAGELAGRAGDLDLQRRFMAVSDDLGAAIEHSLATAAARLGTSALPASPYRRLDAGAIGSLAAGYPLQLWPARDPRLLATVEFLLAHCFFRGGFFQDMTHSGINAYLTLHVAQVLLRAGDARALTLMDTIARLASPTGQWPEAIHPRTLGGCMGDGQHVWAAAEWIMMQRNCFLREEGDTLVLLGGIPPHWLEEGGSLRFGPAPSAFGAVSLRVRPGTGKPVRDVRVEWEAAWHHPPAHVELRLPGFAVARAAAADGAAQLVRDGS